MEDGMNGSSEWYRSWLAAWRPRPGEWPVLLGYGAVFWVLHHLAVLWGGTGYYSL